jgi:transposase
VRAVHRRWRRRKGKLIARALVAKELATIVYAILSKEERFNGYFKGTKLAQLKPHVWPRRANPPA